MEMRELVELSSMNLGSQASNPEKFHPGKTEF